jgi:hypothetical protein
MIESGTATVLIDVAKTAGSIVAQGAVGIAYGNSDTTWSLSNYDGTNDASLMTFNVLDFVPGGIRIGRGTTDNLRATVNDDLTGLVDFTVRGLGYRYFP